MIKINKIPLFVLFTRRTKSSYCNLSPSKALFRTYKPDIVAPGKVSSSQGGTSYAAPIVTGTIALMCEYRPILKTRQHIVKAILAASTSKDKRYETSDTSNTTTTDNFVNCGAGLLDARAALWVISQGRFLYSTGSFSGSAPQTKTYAMEVLSSDSTMRVALAYANKVQFSSDNGHANGTAPASGKMIAELMLQIKDPNGNVVATETKMGANLKVVEFSPSVAGTYTIVVGYIDEAGDNRTTNFGLAWR